MNRPNRIRPCFLIVCLALLAVTITGLSSSAPIARRRAVFAIIAGTCTSASTPWVSRAEANEEEPALDYQSRPRKGNKEAIIRDDYWFISGKTPPRLLSGPLKGDDPEFNAFGSCTTSEDGENNSCTYVGLKQRSMAYSKYASSIDYGARQYASIQSLLRSSDWAPAVALLRTEDKTPPPGPVDAELKMILLATALLTSPNFPGPSKELLVARYYVNEVHFCNQELLAAVVEQNQARALAAWEYGRDAWNSYFFAIDRQIVPKVGDKFAPIV